MNKRSIETRFKLKISLLALLRSKTPQDITVKELCELSELQRGTFYWHYSNIGEIIEEIELEDLGRALEFHNELRQQPYTLKTVELYLNFVKNNEIFTYVFINRIPAFYDFSQKFYSLCIESLCHTFELSMDNECIKRAITYTSYGQAEIIERWIREGFTPSAGVVAEELYNYTLAVINTTKHI